ncbi:MAG: hypothetical protein PF542_04495 [Nanoarchaeota archaeon]|jgi:hypothetical protein|nr:hypothetical protein [Nanoarchaeota archaeon]
MKKNFSYDDIGDSIIISNKADNEKVKRNFMFDSLILSMTNSGKIVGLEIQDFSNFLKESGVNESVLDSIENVVLEVVEKKELVLIKFIITSHGKEQVIPVTRLPIQMIPN